MAELFEHFRVSALYNKLANQRRWNLTQNPVLTRKPEFGGVGASAMFRSAGWSLP